MARVNFEDDVEAQDEFWALLSLVGGERERALGRLILFFRVAQNAYGHDEPMAREELEARFPDMLKSGWAVPVSGGYHAKGAKKHFAWYRQKVVAGKRGGRPNKQVPPVNRTVSAANHTVPAANPLALSLSPALTQKQENTNLVHRGRCTGVKSEFDLEEAYQNYPRKRGKTPGMKRLAREIQTPEDFESLRRAVQNYASEVTGREAQYVMLFSTFANQWRDWVKIESLSAKMPKVKTPEDLEFDQQMAEYASSNRRGEDDVA